METVLIPGLNTSHDLFFRYQLGVDLPEGGLHSRRQGLGVGEGALGHGPCWTVLKVRSMSFSSGL